MPWTRSRWVRSFAPVVALALVSLAGRARADDLRVSTLGGGTWAAAVAQLESDVHGEGRIAPVVVSDAFGRVLPCGRYRVILDQVSARAFTVGACDPETQATTITLVHRAALFDTRDSVPLPLVAGITAVEVLTGGERGGAGLTGGSTLHCTIDVHPYLVDLLHGTHVYLTPGRYVLRPANATVSATARPDGWTLTTASTGTLTVDYDVVDSQRNNAVVLHDRATLACGNAPSPPRPLGVAPAFAPARPFAAMPSVAPVRGAAEVDGRGLPLSTFQDVLPSDDSVEAPSPFVRSRFGCASPTPAARIPIEPAEDLRGTTEVVATITLDAPDEGAALATVRQRAADACADIVTNLTIVPINGGVRATALALRTVTTH